MNTLATYEHLLRSDLTQTARSRSPGSVSQGAGAAGLGRRLGGPQNVNTNYMMQATRAQRKMLFFRENETALLNSIGPGPAKYLKEKADRVRFGECNKFSIPKVSKFFKIV